ncbi:MAG: sigma-70 family RNA polymerase sigma factor, partial [Planctomycetes bacterium]|nr:sigma-70 family RNA polymerase sigma factor [Planctomycetota bacterium]
ADENDADDVEQQTWLLALQRPPRRADSVRGWLITATRNVARKLGRAESRRERHEHAAMRPSAGEPDADLVAEAEIQQRLSRAVLELEQPFRATVLLRYFEGLSVADVAARLDVPVETVKSRLRRARERLRERLDDESGGRRAAWAPIVLTWRDTPLRGPSRLVPAGTGAAAGGIVMTLAKKLVVAAVVLAALGGAAWMSVLATRSSTTPPVGTADEHAAERIARPAPAKRAAQRPAEPTPNAAPDDLPPPVNLDAADRDLDLHGTVVDAAGKGVAGARIATVTYPWRTAELLNMRDRDAEIAGPATRSAIDGTFSLRLARGQSVALRVSAHGFAPIEIPYVLAGERMRVTLRACVRLVVALTDAQGAPVAGASLEVRSGEYDAAAMWYQAVGTTAADGVGTIDGLPSGTRALVTAKHRQKGVGYLWNLDLPMTGELRTELRLKAARVLRGRVVDAETKAPVAGAIVGMGWTLDQPVATDPDGDYEMPGWTGVGDTDVHVRAEGYATDGKVVGSADRVDFELARGYAASGRVVDAERQPLAGTLVGMIASAMDGHEQQISHGYAVSGPNGRFRVTSLRGGMRHVLVVLAAGHARQRRETPTSSSTQDVDLGDVVLTEPRKVEGDVLGSDGAPQRRQTVFLSGPLTGDEVGSFYGRSVTVATDDLGRFRFGGVEPGDYEVVVRPAGGQEIRTKIHVRPNADILNLRITRAAIRDVTITVTDPEGKPLPGVFVTLTNSNNQRIQERTNAAGVAHVAVPEGRAMTWSVYPPHDAARTFLQPAWKPLPDDTSDMTIALEEGAVVTGRVVDPEGAGVAGAWFRLIGADGDERWAEAGADGLFRVLVRKDSRSVVVFDGAVTARGTRKDSGLAARVEGVAAGADIVVRCTRVALDRTLTIVVVSPQGDPVPKASVNLFGGVNPQTDDAGRVAFKDLPARNLTVRVFMQSSDFLAPAPVDVVPDGQELRLVCRSATRITGTVVDKAGTPQPWGSAHAERRGEGVAWSQVGQDGRFALLLPDTDTLSVRVVVDRSGDSTPEATLDDVAPGTQDVLLVVTK